MPRLSSRRISLSFLFLLFSSTCVFAAEEITITTYYPSPYGSYNQLQVNTLGVGDNNGNNVLDSGDVPPVTNPPSGNVWIAGNVGIGTLAPESVLHIAGSNNTPTLLIKPKVMLNGNVSRIRFQDPDGGTTPMNIQFKDDGSADLAIMGGNFGIGVENPGAKLNVAMENPNGWNGPLEALRITSPDSNYWMDLRTYVVAAGNVGYQFRSRQAGGVTYTGLVQDTYGRVGIGTMSPGAPLEVAGQVKITGGSPGVGKVLTSDANGLASWSGGGAKQIQWIAGRENSGCNYATNWNDTPLYWDPAYYSGLTSFQMIFSVGGTNQGQCNVAMWDLTANRAVNGTERVFFNDTNFVIVPVDINNLQTGHWYTIIAKFPNSCNAIFGLSSGMFILRMQ